MKKLLYLLTLTLFVFTSCEQEQEIIDVNDIANKKLPKVTICHYDADTDTWKTISINENALKAHLKHGDFEGSCEDRKTYVPDDGFEQYLINEGYDDILDDYVLTSNISTITYLYLSSFKILDLTGIEDFKSLSELWLRNNIEVSNVDLTKNLNLNILYLRTPNLTSIDLSKNTELTNLWTSNTAFTALDITKNRKLESLRIFYPHFRYNPVERISNLDLSQNINLTFLELAYLNITNLDLSKNKSLNGLSMHGNNVSELDLTNNIILEYLNLSNNALEKLDLTMNSALKTFHWGEGSPFGYDGTIKELDLSKNVNLSNLHIGYVKSFLRLDLTNNINLIELTIYGNDNLSTVNVKNGYNTRIESGRFFNNSSLYCIQVDNINWSYSNWFIQSPSSFSTDCGY